jgi:hypothetical protein
LPADTDGGTATLLLVVLELSYCDRSTLGTVASDFRLASPVPVVSDDVPDEPLLPPQAARNITTAIDAETPKKFLIFITPPSYKFKTQTPFL